MDIFVNQETHNIGEVYLEPDHGMIWLARSNYVGHDQIVCDSFSLAEATLNPNAQVFYDKKPIGKLHSIQYNNRDGFLVGFFSLTVNRNYLPPNDYLFACVKYENNGIKCIRCNRVFRVGSQQCDCIESSPSIQIPKINILSASIYNGMHDNINMLNSKQNLMTEYFGGIIASIKIEDNCEDF